MNFELVEKEVENARKPLTLELSIYFEKQATNLVVEGYIDLR